MSRPLSLSRSSDEPESGEAFIERMKSLVATAGSATAFAKAAGLSQSGFQRYLTGSEPSRKALIAIARAGGVSVEWLATGHGDREGLRHQPHQDGGYRQEADDFVYLEELGTGGPGVVSRRHAVRRDWLDAQGLDPAKLRFLETREDAMAPTIQPGDRLLCESYLHRQGGTIQAGLAPGELPPQGGVYLLRYGDRGPTAVRRLRLDMGGGLLISADADDSLHLHLQGEEQLRKTHILSRVVALWRDL